MATIVRDNLKNKLYILIGAGFGAAKTARPNPLFPIATASTTTESEMVAVAGADGEISWHPSYQLSVVSVDGIPCRDFLETARDIELAKRANT